MNFKLNFKLNFKMSDLLGEPLAIDSIPDTIVEADIRNVFGNYCLKKITREEAENQLKGLNNYTMHALDTIDEIIIKSTKQYMNPTGGITRSKCKRWTDEEDQRLRDAIEKYGTDNWLAVSTYVAGGRTKAQCSQRWNRCLDPKILHNNWTREEEEKLIEAVQRYSPRSWTRVSAELPGRTDVQCRFRYQFITKKMQQNKLGVSSDFNPDLEINGNVDSIVNNASISNDVIQINPTEASLTPLIEPNSTDHN